MKRILIVLIIFAMSSNSSFSSASTLKYGKPCKKIGIEKTYDHLTYVCLKVKKKLVWTGKQYGSLPVRKTPTPAPKPDAVFPKVPTEIVYPNIPTSFQDLNTNLGGVSYGAWKRGSDKILKFDPSDIKITILVGPNTIEDEINSVDSINLVSRLYSNSKQINNLFVIKYSKKDIEWAQRKYESLSPAGYPLNSQNQCNFGKGCVGASAALTRVGDGIILMGQGGDFSGDIKVNGKTRANNGALSGHEYTHTMQMFNACSGNCHASLPRWLMEGGAEWAGVLSSYHADYSGYLAFRDLSLGDLYNYPSKYTVSYILEYLNPDPNNNSWLYWDKYNSWEAYTLGFMATEILTSIYGPDSVMNLYKNVGEGKTFAQAFTIEYSISWESAVSYIAEAMGKQIKELT